MLRLLLAFLQHRHRLQGVDSSWSRTASSCWLLCRRPRWSSNMSCHQIRQRRTTGRLQQRGQPNKRKSWISASVRIRIQILNNLLRFALRTLQQWDSRSWYSGCNVPQKKALCSRPFHRRRRSCCCTRHIRDASSLSTWAPSLSMYSFVDRIAQPCSGDTDHHSHRLHIAALTVQCLF